MPAAAPRAVSSPTTSFALSRADLAVADAVGALMELWGFRRQLGRIWAVLFLSERPLAAPDLCERLRISTGLLSMSLAELRRWSYGLKEAPADFMCRKCIYARFAD